MMLHDDDFCWNTLMNVHFFLSTDTNIFCISLSFPFRCHIFPCFFSPSHAILLFPLFVHRSALLPHITWLVRFPPSPQPCTLQYWAFFFFFTFSNKQFPPPHYPSLSPPPNPTSSTLPSLPFAQATVTLNPLQIPDLTAM